MNRNNPMHSKDDKDPDGKNQKKAVVPPSQKSVNREPIYRIQPVPPVIRVPWPDKKS